MVKSLATTVMGWALFGGLLWFEMREYRIRT